MRQKVYIVSEVSPSGHEKIIAVRLTDGAARSIARAGGDRRVTRFIADKDEFLKPEEKSERTFINQQPDASEGEADGRHKSNQYSGNA